MSAGFGSQPCLGRVDSCPAVLEYPDAIGGEGEVACGAQLVVRSGIGLTCTEGHRFEQCACGRSFCTGWRLASTQRQEGSPDQTYRRGY